MYINTNLKKKYIKLLILLTGYSILFIFKKRYITIIRRLSTVKRDYNKKSIFAIINKKSYNIELKKYNNLLH